MLRFYGMDSYNGSSDGHRPLIPVALAVLAAVAAVVVLSLCASDASDAASGTLDGGVEWSTSGDTLTLTGPSTPAAVPDYTETERPPWSMDGIKKLVVGSGVSRIGNYTFLDSGLEYLSLGPDLGSIGEYAFRHCKDVKKIDVDSKSLTGVDEKAVEDLVGITEVTFSGNVSYIPAVAKWGENIETITIPAGASDIAPEAFRYVTGLKKLVFLPLDMHRPSGHSVFSSHADFEVEFGEGIKSIPDYLFCGTGSMHSITIPDTVETIREGAFSRSGLTEIVMPEGLVTVEAFAFESSYSLGTVTISSTVKSIGSSCFSECYCIGRVNYYADMTDGVGEHIFWCEDYKPCTFVTYCGEGSVVPIRFFDAAPVNELIFDGKGICSGAFGEYDGINLKKISFGGNIESVSNGSFYPFKFYDADGNQMDLTPDSVRGCAFVSTAWNKFSIDNYNAYGTDDDSEALKTPAIGMAVFVAVIAAGLIVSFGRKG